MVLKRATATPETQLIAAFLGRVGVLRALVDGVGARSLKEPTLPVMAFDDMPVEAALDPFVDGFVDALAPGIDDAIAAARAEGQAFAVGKDKIADMAGDFARVQGSTLVRQVTRDVREAIREVVGFGIQGNKSILQMAKELREVVGLTKRDRAAVRAFRARLRASGVSVAEADRQAGRYAQTKIAARARLIAQTEARRAFNVARMAEWGDGIATGRIRTDVHRKWIGRDPCPICRFLAAQPAMPFGVPWQTEWGEFMQPPIHPGCKCSIVLVPPPGRSRRR